MTERCWAFLAADFEAAACEAASAVEQLCELASRASSSLAAHSRIEGEPIREWLERQPEWTTAQRAIAAQFRARVALDEAGVEAQADARKTAERAQADFMQLAISLRDGQP